MQKYINRQFTEEYEIFLKNWSRKHEKITLGIMGKCILREVILNR